jgi:GAF domain-containing protein
MKERTVLSPEDTTSNPSLPGVGEPARVDVLERVGRLTGPADPALDRVARLAARLLSAPVSYVTLVGAGEQRMPGAAELDHGGEPMRSLPVGDSICQFQVVTDEPLVIGDTRADPLTEHNRTVLDGTIGAYAGTPLRSGGGHVLGSLCVIDRAPRSWDQDVLKLLDDLAVVVSNDIEHRLSSRRTLQVDTQARKLLDAWGPHADAVAGLVELAEQSDDPRLQGSAARARASAGRLGAAAATLTREVQRPTAPQSPAATTDLRRLVERAVGGARQATGTSSISLDLPGSPLPVRTDPVRSEQALVHLLVSALHHTPVSRMLAVRLDADAPARSAHVRLSAPATMVPAAELARLVSRFAGALALDGDRPAGPAALRMLRGGVQASSGSVTGSSSADGLVFTARWALAQEAPAVIDLRGAP